MSLTDYLTDLVTNKDGQVRKCCVCKNYISNNGNKSVILSPLNEEIILKDRDISHGYCSGCYEEALRENV